MLGYAALPDDSEPLGEALVGWFTKTCKTPWHTLHSRRCTYSHSSNLSRPHAMSDKRRFSTCCAVAIIQTAGSDLFLFLMIVISTISASTGFHVVVKCR